MTKTKDLFMEQRDYEQHKDDEVVSNKETGLSLELNNLINIDREGIRQKVDAVVVTIQDGWTDPLDALIFAKKGKELFDALEKNVRSYAEAKQVNKGYVKFGTSVTEAMTGVKYDYTSTGDGEWLDLYNKSKMAKEALEEREKFLKGVTKDLEIVDTDSGETYTIKPPIKSGKLGLKLEMQ